MITIQDGNGVMNPTIALPPRPLCGMLLEVAVVVVVVGVRRCVMLLYVHVVLYSVHTTHESYICCVYNCVRCVHISCCSSEVNVHNT